MKSDSEIMNEYREQLEAATELLVEARHPETADDDELFAIWWSRTLPEIAERVLRNRVRAAEHEVVMDAKLASDPELRAIFEASRDRHAEKVR